MPGDEVTVLVTGVGAPPGVSILKALRYSSLPLRVLAMDADPVSVGLFRADGGFTAPYATTDREAYLDRLSTVCRDEQVRLVFFGSEAEMKIVAPAKREVELRSGSLLVLNDDQYVETFTDKLRTVHVLREHGIGVPESVAADDDEGLNALRERYGLPLIIKPRYGSGSRNLFLARTEEEVAFFRRYVPDAVLQERLLPDDEEYTVGIYKSARSERFSSIIFKRSLAAGLTYKAQVVRDVDIDEVVRQFVAAFPVFGPLNLQLRKTASGPKVFEVNLRPSSSVVMRAKLGLNEPELAVRDMILEEELPDAVPELGAFALRYWDEVYVSEDEVNRLRRHTVVQKGRSEKLDLL